jgi:hypothetical protein
MARYLGRSCPRCNGYLGIVLREPGRNVSLQAVNGQRLGCGYRMSWIVIRGKHDAQKKRSLKSSPSGNSVYTSINVSCTKMLSVRGRAQNKICFQRLDNSRLVN